MTAKKMDSATPSAGSQAIAALELLLVTSDQKKGTGERGKGKANAMDRMHPQHQSPHFYEIFEREQEVYSQASTYKKHLKQTLIAQFHHVLSTKQLVFAASSTLVYQRPCLLLCSTLRGHQNR